MKLSFYIGFCISLCSFANVYAQGTKSDTTNKETTKPAVTSVKDFSYAYGYSFAKDLKNNTPFGASELVEKEILKGIKEGLKPDTAKLTATNKYMDDRIKRDTVAKTEKEGKITAYHLGYSAVANMIVTLDIPADDFNYGSLKKGYSDFTKGKSSPFSDSLMQKMLSDYFQKKQIAMQSKLLEERKKEGEKNLAQGLKYLEDNAKKEGIKTTPSGLQYQIIKAGSGPKALLTNTVVTHYTGTLMDGKVFDSSIERGKPASFILNNVIRGWQEGIQLMSAGARYRLFVPADLAYGLNSPASIPPNSILIFDVELLEIKEGPVVDTLKTKMSYSYGFMIGKSLQSLNLSPKEMDPNFFVQGFSKGFDATDEDILAMESLLKTRLDSKKMAESDETAQKIAFAIGFSSSAGVAKQLGIVSDDYDYNSLGLGYATSVKNDTALLSDLQMSEILKSFFEPKQKQAEMEFQKRNEIIAQQNIQKGVEFMEENAKKEGVLSMNNGMQYEIIKVGDGAKPTVEDKVTTHYHGTLLDGTVFDSSVERGEPATFPLKGVIQGWQDGIPLMSVGSKYKFYIPAQLAYGNTGAGNVIAPGSTLVFEVELLRIN